MYVGYFWTFFERRKNFLGERRACERLLPTLYIIMFLLSINLMVTPMFYWVASHVFFFHVPRFAAHRDGPGLSTCISDFDPRSIPCHATWFATNPAVFGYRLGGARAFLTLIPEVFPATPRVLRRTRSYRLGPNKCRRHRFSYHLQRITDSSRPALLRDQCRFTQYPSLIFLQWVFYEGQPRAHFGECKSRRSPPRKITAMDPGPDNARSLIGVTKTSAIKILGNGLDWAIF